jgi:hypothetical protein
VLNEACTSYELPDLGKAVRCVLLLYVQQEADAAVVFGQVALCRLHPSAVTWERAVTRQRRRAPNPRWRRPDDTPPAVRVVPWRAVYLLTTRSRGTRHSRHAARRTTAVARRSRRSKTFAVEAAQRDWLDTMAAAWQLPDTGKALRVVLEYAVADTDPQYAVFGVVRKACTHRARVRVVCGGRRGRGRDRHHHLRGEQGQGQAGGGESGSADRAACGSAARRARGGTLAHALTAGVRRCAGRGAGVGRVRPTCDKLGFTHSRGGALLSCSSGLHREKHSARSCSQQSASRLGL